MNCCGVGRALGGVVEGLVVDLQHVDVGVDGLGAGLVAVHQLDDRRDVLAATDHADDAALAERGGHDAGHVAALVLVEEHADVVVRELGLELVDADEVRLGVRLGGRQRVGGEQEARGDHHVGVVLEGRVDVLGVVGLGRGLDVVGLEAEAVGRGLHALVGVLVERAVVDLADVGDQADGEAVRAPRRRRPSPPGRRRRAGPGRRRRRRRRRRRSRPGSVVVVSSVLGVVIVAAGGREQPEGDETRTSRRKDRLCKGASVGVLGTAAQ